MSQIAIFVSLIGILLLPFSANGCLEQTKQCDFDIPYKRYDAATLSTLAEYDDPSDGGVIITQTATDGRVFIEWDEARRFCRRLFDIHGHQLDLAVITEEEEQLTAGAVCRGADGNDSTCVVIAKKCDNSELFNDFVAAGDTFEVFGCDSKGTLGTEITIDCGNGREQDLHTSCSQELFIGLQLLDSELTISDGSSKNNGQLCEGTGTSDDDSTSDSTTDDDTKGDDRTGDDDGHDGGYRTWVWNGPSSDDPRRHRRLVNSRNL